MIEAADDYFTKGCGRCDRFDTEACATRIWAEGLARLRAICRSAGLEETVRWGQPCYRHAGCNIAIIGAFRDRFVLGFFDAALLKDREHVLEKPGQNTRHANTIRFESADQVERTAPILLAYLGEAVAHAEAGRRPPRASGSPDLPHELVETLDDDPALATAFYALTPGRQRSYVIALSGAKTAETRRRRITKFRDRIIEGKGAHER